MAAPRRALLSSALLAALAAAALWLLAAPAFLSPAPAARARTALRAEGRGDLYSTLACDASPSAALRRSWTDGQQRPVSARPRQASAAGLAKTAVPGVLGIPGGTWGTAPGSSDGPWGYYVPQGQVARKVDTSHVSGDLAALIQCLKPELALPWGFLIMEGEAATLVDVPYFSTDLVQRILEIAPKGVTQLMFTHSDFIGMAEPDEWRKAFAEVVRVAHAEDVGKGSFEVLLEGAGPWNVGDFRIDAAPGHTQGSVIISSQARSTSFGGDSMGFWEGAPTGYPKMARFSCRQQAKSLRAFADDAPFFEFWFPGHGLPMRFDSLEDRREQLYRAAEGLETAAAHVSAP